MVFAFFSQAALAEDWFPNPNADRLFFAPTGKNPVLKKNSIYTCDALAYYGRIYMGESFSLGGGTFPILGLFYIAPQMSLFENENFSWAAGILSADLFANGLYTVGTYSVGNLSLTGGIISWYPLISVLERPFMILGGEYRLMEQFSFVAESWQLPVLDSVSFNTIDSINAINIIGGRFFGQNFSFEIGVFSRVVQDGITAYIPCLNYVYYF
ncbi:MAG: hypothetical protein ABIH69_05040 [bacterium]